MKEKSLDMTSIHCTSLKPTINSKQFSHVKQRSALNDTCSYIFWSCISIGPHDQTRDMTFITCWTMPGQSKIGKLCIVVLWQNYKKESVEKQVNFLGFIKCNHEEVWSLSASLITYWIKQDIWSPDISFVSQHYEEKQALLQHQNNLQAEVRCMNLLLQQKQY